MENNLYELVDKKVQKIIVLTQKYMKWYKKSFIEEEIKKAYLYAREAHEWVFRLSWEPYIDHPVEATLILLELKPDIYTIQSCLLHDVVEDTSRTLEDIEEGFWSEVSHICHWLTKLSKVRYSWEDRSVWSLRKMFVAMSEDLRVIFVKLSDRLHNMKTLHSHPKKEKREKIALETLNIYTPIADRLGLHSFKNMLDEECFKILNPEDYENIKNQLEDLKLSIISFKKNAKHEVETLLELDNINSKNKISFKVDFRVKSIYSIYNKMKRKNISKVSDLYDLYWLKILVEDIADCYRVLGLVHSKWTPLPNRFKDYIALPKPNWYKSLHTTVIWLLKNFRQQPTEIQIKTYKMDLSSEIWIAAHFEYKEKWSKIAQDIDWVKDLKNLMDNMENNKDFMDLLSIDVFKNRIFVLTPKWKYIDLPSGVTPIDFAYEIHSDIWNHIAIAKVNWQVVPLDKELKNWDIVEIIIDKNKKPNPFYISVVKTNKAKNGIRSFLRAENKDLHIERWRDLINNLLQKSWLPKLDKDLTVLKNIDDKINTIQERIDILEQVWNLSVNPSSIIRKIILNNKELKKIISLKSKKDKKWQENIENVKDVKNIIIWWEKDMLYTIATCCKEKLKDKIVAYINWKWIITIHNRDCKTLTRLNKERFLSAYYEWEKLNNVVFNVLFVFQNRIWVLKKLSDILFEMNINILEISSSRKNIKETQVDLKLEIADHDYLIIDRFLSRVMLRLKDDFISCDTKNIEI